MNELLVFGGAVLLPVAWDSQYEERIREFSRQYGLSDKEREIARQLYNGKNNYEIAEAMSVAENTVKSHNYRLYKKLGVENRVQAVNLIREGINHRT